MTETGWLVEALDREKRIIWFGGITGDSTRDPNEAIRFARKEDARRMVLKLKSADMAASAFCGSERDKRYVGLTPSRKWEHAHATEHQWSDEESGERSR